MTRRSREDLADWQNQLTEYHLMFSATGNPLFVWIAYQWCRGLRRPVPQWVLCEFDSVAEKLVDTRAPEEQPFFHSPTSRNWQRALAVAMGFGERKGGGPTNPFSAMLRDFDNLHLAMRVRVLVDAEKLGETKAAGVVAKDCDVTQGTVEDAWAKFASVVRAGDLQRQSAHVRSLNEQIRHYQQEHGATIAFGRPITAPARRRSRRGSLPTREFPRKVKNSHG